MKRKILISLALFLSFFILGAGIKAKAGVSDNVTGWLWGGSEDANLAAPGIPNDGNETGAGWISMNGSNYGVNIPSGEGNLSGYAWSENLGWIGFNPSDVSDCGGDPARRVGNELRGYARIMGIKQEMVNGNAGGWMGCISLRGTNYGVSIDPSSGKLSGYGWNGENNNDPAVGANVANGIGWIDFSRASIQTVKRLKICRNSCDSGNDPLTVTNKLYIASGESVDDLKACFSNSDSDKCSGGTDVTNDSKTEWKKTSDPDSVIGSISANGAYKKISAANSKTGVAEINVSYKPDADTYDTDFGVNVSGCIPNCDANNHCKGEVYMSCNEQCVGTKADCVWHEVKPE